jgi:type IV pilus assembly protein PilM
MGDMSAYTTFGKLFPPPEYITLPAVGMDISDTSLKYIGFKRVHTHDTNLALTTWGDIAIPSGVVERGTVHDKGVLVTVLREAKERTGASYVTVSLPEERAYLFETTLPRNTPPRQMRELLEFRLEENVPLSPRDAYFDFVPLGIDEGTNDTRLAVAVYSRDTINNYYDACVAAELLPVAFEIEAQAIARAAVPWGTKEPCMIVDFGKTRMGVGIVFRGVLAYTSTIDVSGEQMSAAIRHVLGEVPESELTAIKNTQGIVATPDNRNVARALEEIMKTMADELAVRMHYWHTRSSDRDERQIKHIVLCGGSANLWGLPEYIADSLHIPTERALVWQNAFSLDEYVPHITRKYSYGYATAIGLALRGFVSSV